MIGSAAPTPRPSVWYRSRESQLEGHALVKIFRRQSGVRKSITIMVGTVVLIILAATSFALTQGKGTQTNVAYKPTPYPGKPPLPSDYKPPSSTTPATISCSKSTLKLYAMWPGAYQGYATESVELSNASSKPCFLTDALPMSVTLSKGGSEPVSLKSYSSTRIDLHSNQVALLIFGSPGACNTLVHKPTSSVTLKTSSGNMTIPGLKLDVGCGQPTLLLFFALTQPMSPPPTVPTSVQNPPAMAG